MDATTAELLEIERLRATPRTLWGDALRRLMHHRLAVVGLAIILFFSAVAILAPLIAPYDPIFQDYSLIQRSPTWAHPFGTDTLGRDQLSRLIYGTRTSLAVGFFSQLIVIALGILIGGAAALGGRGLDNLVMRFTDMVYSFPDLLFIILLATVLGSDIRTIFLAIGLVNWTDTARLVRGQMLSLRERDFVLAARALGASNGRIVFVHMLPNALSPVIVAATFGLPRAIFAEAILSFLGLGIRPPTPSWGTMIQDGYNAILSTPALALFPAVAIAVLMMAFTFLGDGLRDAIDPRQH